MNFFRQFILSPELEGVRGREDLLVGAEESVVGGGELGVQGNGVSVGSAPRVLPHLLLGLDVPEPKRVHSIRVAEELSSNWVALNVFPSSIRPSARHQLQLFLRWVTADASVLQT